VGGEEEEVEQRFIFPCGGGGQRLSRRRWCRPMEAAATVLIRGGRQAGWAK
jgi:hypothetical protein